MTFKRGFRLLVTYLRPQWRAVAILALLLVCTIVVQVVNPQILSNFIDSAWQGKPLQTLLITAALFLGLGLLSQALSGITAYVSGNLAWQTTNQMRVDLVRHCLHLEMPFHNTRSPGELIERTDEDVSMLSNLFSLFVLQVLVNLLLLVCVLVILFLKEWRLGLAMTVYALLCLFVFGRTSTMMGSVWVDASQASAELHGFVGEHVAGVADIRSNGAVPAVMRRFYEVRRNAFLKRWRAHRFSTILSGGTDLLLICGSVGAFILGAALFQAGAISLGTVYLVVTYTQLLTQPLQEIMAQIDDLRQARAGLERIQELYEIQSTLQDGAKENLPAGTPGVECDEVSFAYQPGVPVLEQITLRLEPGEVLSILGHTGSGKTTLARLLFRLYDPTAGTIRLSGEDIRNVKIAAVRKCIGMVTQEVQVFHASVRDNLTFFERTIADERIVQVLKELGLASWYKSLPRGLDTVIASSTSEEAGLSAGEAQLLAFARVFLQDPAIVILDEASSRLDPATERSLEQAMERLLAGRTALIIAHRLTTIKRADKILILEQGKVREYGAREQLLQNPESVLNHFLALGLEGVQV